MQSDTRTIDRELVSGRQQRDVVKRDSKLSEELEHRSLPPPFQEQDTLGEIAYFYCLSQFGGSKRRKCPVNVKVFT